VNILYLSHRIPYPPNKGDKIRSFHQIEYLSRKHRVHVACLIDAEEDRAHVAGLRPYCASLDAAWRGGAGPNLRAALALCGDKPLSVAAFYSPDLARKIERRLETEPMDVGIVFSSQMGQYVPAGLPTVVDFIDVDSEKWRVYADRKPWPLSWLYRIEADRLRRYEWELARAHDESLFVAENEAAVFRRGTNGVTARAIPNGVDLDYFRRPAGEADAKGAALVFVGMMDYFPNIDAVVYMAEEIFPRILSENPAAVFRIVGRNPSKRVRDLARRRNVEVAGAVADVRPYLTDAAVSVAPFRIARGLQNKVLEAMAMQVPVVGTKTALQGIEAGPEDGIRVEDDPAAFARAVLDFLRDPEARREAGLRGRRFVERHHRWQDHGAALEALLSEVVARHARPLQSAGGPC
jgi:sugar transferase (PEP-CTERM/EpsH1 system associated)